MKYNRLIGIIVALAAVVLLPQVGRALTSTYFASSSKLSTGKWVKVWVAEDGIYEITDAELQGMGFANPEKVKVFGYGGLMLGETFSKTYIDDLSQIPTLRENGKTMFYGRGVVEMSVKTSGLNKYYVGKVNNYSTRGCYFLTDADTYSAMPLVEQPTSELGENKRTTSNDYYYHEKESRSWDQSGKRFLGESLREGGKISFTFNVPNIVSGEPSMVTVAVGADVDETSSVFAKVNGTDVAFATGTNVIYPVSGQITYNYCSPAGAVVAECPDQKVKLDIELEDLDISDAALDYFVMTYAHDNVIPSDSAQVRMGINNPQAVDAVMVPAGNANLHVWNVTAPQTPKECELLTEDGECGFTPTAGTWGQYVMFDSSKELKKILSSEAVENQNLHALTKENMVIICADAFKEQAERIANVHREKDGMSVVVVDQEHIFNEFSSGKPDCTAYRMFLKMLYDRNMSGMKYVLLFGTGSYDNRCLGGKKSEYQLMTYQSENSNSEVASFVSDDYFGFMDDSSGTTIPVDMLRLCIGRIPAGTLAEAKLAADKIEKYVDDDDSEEWHGKALIIADEGDEDMHMYQAEGARMEMDAATGSSMYVGKAYVPWFAKNANNESIVGRQKITDYNKAGILLASYIGHANYTFFTSKSKMWRSTDASTIVSSHVPFFSVAACNTARFDSDNRGIVEEMIHNPKGGAIGVMASARTVYSTQNDKLNCAFIKNMLSTNDKGDYNTLGEAYKAAKMIFASEYNVNKMSFILFGDPALKVRYPYNYGKINTINDKTVGSEEITVSPMTTMKVTGVVTTAGGEVDTSFNGEVTVTLYDKGELYKSIKDRYSSLSPLRDAYYPRERLAETKAEVKNGEYEAELVVPRDCKAQGDTCQIRMFAKSETSAMVMGQTSDFKIGEYDEATALTDTEAPVIARLQVGEKGGEFVTANPNVYIEATDNVGIDARSFSMNNGMKLVLDGGQESVTSITDYFTVLEDGKKAQGTINLQNLAPGRHTIEYVVNDLAGNEARKEVEFFVGSERLEGELTLAEDAVRANADVNLTVEESTATKVRYYVEDALGNVVVVKDTTDTSWTWDLKNAEGQRVPAGRYTCHASFENADGATGVTPNVSIVVMEP